MAWVVLVIAGLLEVAWASLLPATNGFTRVVPTIGFVALLVGSMWGLSRAAGTIPVGTAYAVWVGVGAVGAAVVGIVVHDEPATPMRVACLALLVVAIVGLKLTGSH